MAIGLPVSFSEHPKNMFVQRHAWLVMSSEAGPSSLMEGPIQAMEKLRQDGRAIARSPLGVCHVKLGPVITAEADVALAGASQHTKNTAELRYS